MTPLEQALASDLTVPFLGVCAFALGFWIRRQVRQFNRPAVRPRVRPERSEPIDLGDAIQDFIGGDGRTRLAVALARSTEMAPARVTSPGAMTTTHGGTHEKQYR